MTKYGQDPNEFVSYEEDDQYGDVLPVNPPKASKPAKLGKTGKDPLPKAKKPVLPVISQYEGWMITYVDGDKLQPGHTPSWSMSRKAQLPFGIQELRDLATDQEKRDGNLSSQFSKLCANQQEIVNRLVTEKNSAEQQTNAEWVLVCVKKLHKETRTAFRAYKINDRMRVIMRRQEKPQEIAEPSQQKGVGVDENIIDLSIPVVKPTEKKDASPKAAKVGDKKVKVEKKKVGKKDQAAQNDYEQQWPESDPFQQGQDPFQQQHDPFQQQQDPFRQQQDPFQQHQQQPDPFQQHQQHQQQHDPFRQHQQQQDPFQQHQQQQQQHDPFQHHHQQQQPYQQQDQPPYVDPYNMHNMSGALPNDDGRIPVPGHGHLPEAPMAPQHPHQHPFQPFAGVRQAEPRLDPRQQDPSAFGQPHISARHRSRSRSRQEPERESRRDSHSRPRQEPERKPRRDSVDSDKIRRKEVRKIGEILKTELLGEVRGEIRGEIRGALREAAAEDKVHRWPTGASYPSYPPTASSGQSTGQDDVWSSPPSSDGRRYSHGGSPDTSPERSERFYPQPREQRPAGSLHRRGSSGYASPRQDDRRYYADRERVVRPHNSQRERERYRDDGRARSPKYVSERREVVDDYPDVQYHRQQQQRKEPKIYAEPRPRAQRRVTDYPGTLPTADFDRRHRSSVDYTDPRVYGDSRERPRGGQRERQTMFHH
jgi:hypothetical protein